MVVGVVITRFKAKTKFKLDLTGTGTELSLAKKDASLLKVPRLKQA